jgi:hypothetical protein
VFPAHRGSFLLGFDCQVFETETTKLACSASFASRSAGLSGQVFRSRKFVGESGYARKGSGTVHLVEEL